mmetsp:Transcript_41798/g.73540  ORF Transcript_41798/g.73540 Transcript_41798/m.73540 type:complete len:223 (-) Transcript_41798:350-1018(-)
MPSYLGHRPVAPISPLLVSTHDIEDGGGSEYVRGLLAQLPFTLPLIYARANTEPNGTGQRNVDDERSRHFVRALVITPKKSTATLKDHMERDREQIPSHNAFSFAMGDVEPNGSRRPTIKIKAYSVRSRGEPKMDHVRPPPREVHQVEAGEQSNLKGKKTILRGQRSDLVGAEEMQSCADQGAGCTALTSMCVETLIHCPLVPHTLTPLCSSTLTGICVSKK